MTPQENDADASSIMHNENDADASSIVNNENNATPLAIDRYHPLWNYLPKDIQAEEQKAENHKAYLLGELHKHQQRAIQRQESIAIWREQNLRYTPEDMLGDREWQNYYPAIKHTNDPLIGLIDTGDISTNPLWEAPERDPQEQRILATGLLRGTLSKAQISQLTERAQKLICSMDPMNATFLTGEDLKNALKQEGLTSKEAINRTLNRKATTYCKQEDQREALRTRWETRDRLALQTAGAQTGDWGEDEGVVLWTCTIRILDSITNPQHDREWYPYPQGYAFDDIKLGIWGILREAEDRGNIDEYAIDPREETHMDALRECLENLSNQPLEEWHYAVQNREYPGQTWVRETGMMLLYGGNTEEWWKDMPNALPESKTEQEIENYRKITLRDARTDADGNVKETWDMATKCMDASNLRAIIKNPRAIQ